MARLGIETLRTLAYTGISGTYAAVGTALSNTLCAFRIVNNTNGDLIFSFDGSTDQFFIPANGFLLLDISSDSPQMLQSGALVLAKGARLWVKQSTAPTSGSVYFEGYYSVGT